MSVRMFLFFRWEAASISAWGASRLNNTTCNDFISITICMDSYGTSENRFSSIKVHFSVPVVVVTETADACSHMIAFKVSGKIMTTDVSASSGQVTVCMNMETVIVVSSVDTLLQVLEVTFNSHGFGEMAKSWRIELHPSPD